MFVPGDTIWGSSSASLPETVRNLKAEIASKEKLRSLWFSLQISGAKTGKEIEPKITKLNREITVLKGKLNDAEQAIPKLELMKLAALKKPAPPAKEVPALSPQVIAAAKQRMAPELTPTKQKILETRALIVEGEKLKKQIDKTASEMAYDKPSFEVARLQSRVAAANIDVLKSALQALEHQDHIEELEGKIQTSPDDLNVIIPLVREKEKEQDRLQSLAQKISEAQEKLSRSMQAMSSAGGQKRPAGTKPAQARKIVKKAVETIRDSSKRVTKNVNPNTKENVPASQNKKGLTAY